MRDCATRAGDSRRVVGAGVGGRSCTASRCCAPVRRRCHLRRRFPRPHPAPVRGSLCERLPSARPLRSAGARAPCAAPRSALLRLSARAARPARAHRVLLRAQRSVPQARAHACPRQRQRQCCGSRRRRKRSGMTVSVSPGTEKTTPPRYPRAGPTRRRQHRRRAPASVRAHWHPPAHRGPPARVGHKSLKKNLIFEDSDHFANLHFADSDHFAKAQRIARYRASSIGKHSEESQQRQTNLNRGKHSEENRHPSNILKRPGTLLGFEAQRWDRFRLAAPIRIGESDVRSAGALLARWRIHIDVHAGPGDDLAGFDSLFCLRKRLRGSQSRMA